MISLIEVICPHCGARGQITLPPVGAIVIGPCPQCEELVVVFCGKVLPLDKETMVYGSPEQKREHLMTVITGFLEEKLAQISFDVPEDDEALTAETRGEASHGASTPEIEGGSLPSRSSDAGPTVISTQDVEHFVNDELALLDNKDYFRAVFG
ncbi:MAG: hypothetical protein HZB26_25695 [Candidatus Hydrogenedentes bacterium]|nr:hypothetical protein [Candidatus Hydrogenedentota bacterium]